jgi:peptidoglycan/LPS O-acetylase OafA/YrhL
MSVRAPRQSAGAVTNVGAGQQLDYVPAFDGIRGIAVLAIMVYHGGLLLTSGGFYSLDTFFTLSGFLITTLLLAEWQRTGSIRLARFWARRARRLLPALLLLLVVVLLYTRFAFPPGSDPGIRLDTLSTLFYVANWHFILVGSNYFASTGVTSPLLHTWSLAVEEQFYLVWPLVLLLVFRTGRSLRFLFGLCVVGACLSALLMAWLYSPAAVNRIYYGTDTRAQSLLVGAALATAFRMVAERRHAAGTDRRQDDAASTPDAVAAGTSDAWVSSGPDRRAWLLASVAGVIGVLVTAALWIWVSVDDAFAFRGGFLLAALATAAVLANIVIAPRSLVPRCLAVRPLRALGRISYGLYLWHFPLILWLNESNTGLGGWELFALRFGCTVVVATLSYRLVELPIRQRRLLKTWSAWVATPVGVTGVVVVAVLASSVTPVTAASTSFRPPAAHRGGIYAGPPVKVLLLGDSTALTLGLGLSAYERAYNIELKDDGVLGCGVTDGSEVQLKGITHDMTPECSGAPGTESWQQMWAHQLATVRPNVVMILVGRWEVANRTYHGRWTNILNPSYAAYVQRQLGSAVRLAGSQGAKVMLLTAPCYDSGEQPNGSGWPEDSPKRLAAFNAIVRRVAATSANSTLVNFEPLACPSGHYQTYIEGVDARYDGVHFTLGGGVVFESSLFPIAEQLGREQMAHITSGR